MLRKSLSVINKAFIWILRSILAICLIVLLYALIGQGLGRVTVNDSFRHTEGGIDIFVLSNGIHTDFILPIEAAGINWNDRFDLTEFEPSYAEAEMIAFGWGERGLYENVPTWGDLRARHVVSAMLIPTRSALHVYYFPQAPQTGPLIKKVTVSEEQYLQLADFIWASFDTDAQGEPINMNCCWYSAVNDNFYESQRSYHMLHTCNNWTNRALKTTGVRTGYWAPFHTDILRHLDEIPR